MSVLTLVIILAQGISDTNYAKQKIIAGYLAQEGAEYMRNLRDSKVISAVNAETGWNDFKTQIINCIDPGACYFDDSSLLIGQDITQTIFSSCDSPSSCPELYYSSSSGMYNYDNIGGKKSGFIRRIVVNLINVNEIKVTSTVSWNQSSGQRQVIFSENLFNWIE
jgi:hypothetical protein